MTQNSMPYYAIQVVVRFWKYTLIFIGSLFLISCQVPFHPIQDDKQVIFSINGYLDASADTQWVRAFPARNQISTDSIPEMIVTLKELETGNTAVMHDSLFTLANGIRVVNVWTTMDVKPEHTYRLLAERPDGATSSVTVRIPSPFPMPTVEYPWNDCRARITIQEVKKLADVQWVWYYKINSSGYIRERIFRFPRRRSADSLGPGSYSVNLKPEQRGPSIILPKGEVVEHRKSIFVASGGPEWNDGIESLNDIEYALPETASNINNGVGYLVGIFSRKPPYRCG